MQWSDIPRNPTTRTLRQFALLCLIVFGGLGGWKWVHAGASAISLAVFALGVTVGVIGVVAPRAIKPVFVAWMSAAFPLGWAFSRVALLVLYLLVITPLALVFRLAGRDVLGLRRASGRDTYWTRKPQGLGVNSYFRQF